MRRHFLVSHLKKAFLRQCTQQHRYFMATPILLNQKKISYYKTKAKKFLSEGDLLKAIEMYDKLLGETSIDKQDRFHTLKELANILLLVNDLNGAEERISEANSLVINGTKVSDKDLHELFALLAILQARHGNIEIACHQLEFVEALDVENQLDWFKVYDAFGDTFFSKNQYEEAVSWYKKALKTRRSKTDGNKSNTIFIISIMRKLMECYKKLDNQAELLSLQKEIALLQQKK